MPNPTSKSIIRAVLFDLGKVLLHFDFTHAFKRLARHGKDLTPRDIHDYFVRSGLEVLYDGGRITSRVFYQEVRKSLALDITYAEFQDIWNQIFTPIRPMVHLVSTLRQKGYRLVLISNTNAMHYAYVKKKYPVFRKFHRHILSYKEKVRKPDERIYRTAIRACQAIPGQILYVDDRADLTEAAAALGLNVFTFKNNYPDLKQRMKELRIL